jgi:hypothetical protein
VVPAEQEVYLAGGHYRAATGTGDVLRAAVGKENVTLGVNDEGGGDEVGGAGTRVLISAGPTYSYRPAA